MCEVLRMVQGSKARLKSGLPAVEQAGPLLVLASLDKNSDGIICPEELALYREEGQRMVDNTLAQLLNLGVVAALLMSIVYPMAWEMVECADDSPFDTSLLDGFKYASYASLQGHAGNLAHDPLLLHPHVCIDCILDANGIGHQSYGENRINWTLTYVFHMFSKNFG